MGGVLELFDAQVHRDNVVWQPDAAGMAAKIQQTLEAGKISTVTLTDRVMHGRSQWVQWHRSYAQQQRSFIQVCGGCMLPAALHVHSYRFSDVHAQCCCHGCHVHQDWARAHNCWAPTVMAADNILGHGLTSDVVQWPSDIR